jgi:hypothetical protein
VKAAERSPPPSSSNGATEAEAPRTVQAEAQRLRAAFDRIMGYERGF